MSSAKQQANVGVRTAGFISSGNIVIAPVNETKKVAQHRLNTSVALPRPNTSIRGRPLSSLIKISPDKV